MKSKKKKENKKSKEIKHKKQVREINQVGYNHFYCNATGSTNNCFNLTTLRVAS